MGSVRGGSVPGLVTVLLSAATLVCAAVIANGALAVLGRPGPVVALLALNQVPRDRDW